MCPVHAAFLAKSILLNLISVAVLRKKAEIMKFHINIVTVT